ncbi:MAG TPA: flavin reductase family protein [Croceicoccus sp.]|nr:flavin reductase family protein [Croceicoccus sp.]
MDQQAFRRALGAFPTGVTIVTTRGLDGQPVGVTASSFNSVSLDPPLVLWSLARTSRSYPDFAGANHFAVHVLAADQDALSNRFAKSGEDKFAGLTLAEGVGGVPLLPEFGAQFECRVMHRYEGGDHVILVGEVVAFHHSERAPLVFHGGRYAEARERFAADAGGDTVDLETASFTDSFLLYLISRAHYQATSPIRDVCERVGLTEAVYAVMCRLSMTGGLTAADVTVQMGHTGLGIDDDLISAMIADGLVADAGDANDSGLRMTSRGEESFLEVLSAAKAFEDDLLTAFSPGESADLKRLLRKFIVASENETLIAWRDA